MNIRFAFVAAVAAGLAFASFGSKLPDAKIVLGDGTEIAVPDAGGKAKTLQGNPKAARLANRTARKVVTAAPVEKNGLKIVRCTYEGPGYTRTEIGVKNTSDAPVMINRFEFLKDWSPDGQANGTISGNTDGSVAVFPKCFVGVEHPMARVTVKDGKATATLPREFEIKPGEAWRASFVIGEYAEGQLRRDFQKYLNLERAHPYRVMPHYNSWYDLNIGRNDAPWQKRMNEAEALKQMRVFREELSEKRGVFIDSYLWDDGWDNWDSMWDFHGGFPNGFKALADEAHKVKGSSIGCWMSPCGGYGGSCNARVKYAKANGIIGPNDGLLRMCSPTYYAAFRDRVIKMIKDYDMNLFKFDRMGGGGDCNGANAKYAPDMEAIVRLTQEMRAAKQDVFVNATVGTWASPFWLMYADSIWRGGGDYGGQGGKFTIGPTVRQRWITYRDDIIYDRFVSKAPLFPLNSLMNHGIIVTRHGGDGTGGDGVTNGAWSKADTPAALQDFCDEMWMSMGCGTDLQEYYISPELMYKSWWDELAKGIKWLKANEATLRDVHWVGGDPFQGQHGPNGQNKQGSIYGYASLGEKDAIVILRNSSDKPQTFAATYKEIFELPAGRTVSPKGAKVVYAHDAKHTAGKDALKVELQPFGIVLLQFAAQ